MTEFNFLKEFILDANEQFEKIEQAIINLEKEFTKNDIDGLFRAFHTLKGNSSIAGLLAPRDISHAVEGIISDVKNSVIPMSPEVTDVILASVDAIKQHIKSDAKNKRVNAAPLLSKIAKVRKDLKASVSPSSVPLPKQKFIIKTIDELAILEIPEFFNKNYIHDITKSLVSFQKRGIKRYIFNFRIARSVSSCDVSDLATIKKHMEALGAKAVSCEMSPIIEKAFETAGKSDEMNIKKTLKEAVGSI